MLRTNPKKKVFSYRETNFTFDNLLVLIIRVVAPTDPALDYIIDEYRSSSDCDDYERSQWDKAYNKFEELRDRLSRTITYKTKNFGIYVDYPDIVENRY